MELARDPLSKALVPASKLSVPIPLRYPKAGLVFRSRSTSSEARPSLAIAPVKLGKLQGRVSRSRLVPGTDPSFESPEAPEAERFLRKLGTLRKEIGVLKS